MNIKTLTFALLLGLALTVNAANKTQRVTQCATTVTLTEAVDYVITSTEPFSTAGTIDISNPDAAVIFENIRPSEVISKYLVKVTANGVALTNNSNCRVSIYRHGAIVLPHSDTKNADGTDFYPLTTYSGDNFTGEVNQYNKTTRYTKAGGNFPIRSFKIKRGYMVTMANNTDGTGYSHCFIANSGDREVDLTKEGNGKGAFLADKVGFFRIFRWQWPGKLGMSDARDDKLINLTNASWFYDWGAGNSLRDNAEYVPQRHHEAGQSNGQGYKGAWESFGTINNLNNTNTHILGQNEPDNTSGSGEVYTYVTSIPDNPREKHGDYPLVDVAKDFLYSGMRIGTFACCNPNSGMVSEYVNWCRNNNIRVDFVATHYYIGGTDPAGCVSRLKSLYNATGLPVWATEWNNGANWTTEGGFSTDGGWYSWGSGNDQQKNGEWLRDVLKRADNEPWLERLAVYNAVEGKREIWTNGAPTKAAEVLSTYKSGFAYNEANEYWMPWTYKNPTDLVASYDVKTKVVTLSWKHLNGKQTNNVIVECKIQNAGNTWKELGEVGIVDKYDVTYTSKALSFLDMTGNTGAITFRIKDKDADGKTRNSNEAAISIPDVKETDGMQYGKLAITGNDAMKVNYNTSFSASPAVIMGVMTNNNRTFYPNILFTEQGVASYTFKMSAWKKQSSSVTTISAKEELPFLALPQGARKFGNLDAVVGNQIVYNTETEIEFVQAFPEGVTPVIIPTVQKISPTSLYDYPMNVVITEVTNKGFKCYLKFENAETRSFTMPQKVAYIAITPGTGYFDADKTMLINAGFGENPVYGSAKLVEFKDGDERLYMNNPMVFAFSQTNNYPSATILRNAYDEKVSDTADEHYGYSYGCRIKRMVDTSKSTGVSDNANSADKVGYLVIADITDKTTVPMTGINNVSASDDALMPVVNGKTITVPGATDFEVFNAAGTKVNANAPQASGIYVVKVAGASYKVIVK
ncbi:MAG: hypothetical protein J5663_00660 [Bacteroidaceae bacterium]|nr:hypothetical protein [Bacteroidaceae bacterium]